jgi:hypothetical protein
MEGKKTLAAAAMTGTALTWYLAAVGTKVAKATSACATDEVVTCNNGCREDKSCLWGCDSTDTDVYCDCGPCGYT